MSRVAANGRSYRIEWALDSRGRMPVRDAFYAFVPLEYQARMLRLFKVLAETGRIKSRQQFRQLKHPDGDLWEFKSFQERLFGDYRSGRRFVIAHRPKPKKKDRADPEEIKRAITALKENDEYEKLLEKQRWKDGKDD